MQAKKWSRHAESNRGFRWAVRGGRRVSAGVGCSQTGSRQLVGPLRLDAAVGPIGEYGGSTTVDGPTPSPGVAARRREIRDCKEDPGTVRSAYPFERGVRFWSLSALPPDLNQRSSQPHQIQAWDPDAGAAAFASVREKHRGSFRSAPRPHAVVFSCLCPVSLVTQVPQGRLTAEGWRRRSDWNSRHDDLSVDPARARGALPASTQTHTMPPSSRSLMSMLADALSGQGAA
jgi:hypothetical protein